MLLPDDIGDMPMVCVRVNLHTLLGVKAPWEASRRWGRTLLRYIEEQLDLAEITVDQLFPCMRGCRCDVLDDDQTDGPDHHCMLRQQPQFLRWILDGRTKPRADSPAWCLA